MRTSYRLLVSAAAVVGLSLGGACSSSSNGGFDDDGGTTHDGGGGGGGDGGGTIPDDAGDPFCTAQADFQTRCSATTACDRNRLAICPQISAAVSDAVRQAAATCGVQADCSKPFIDVVTGACVADKLQNATPTAAQTKVATDYCAACDPSTSGCAAAFFTGGAGATGLSVLIASDDVAGQIDGRCAVANGDGGTAACKSAFLDCASRELQAAQPTAGGCGDN